MFALLDLKYHHVIIVSISDSEFRATNYWSTQKPAKYIWFGVLLQDSKNSFIFLSHHLTKKTCAQELFFFFLGGVTDKLEINYVVSSIVLQLIHFLAKTPNWYFGPFKYISAAQWLQPVCELMKFDVKMLSYTHIHTLTGHFVRSLSNTHY